MASKSGRWVAYGSRTRIGGLQVRSSCLLNQRHHPPQSRNASNVAALIFPNSKNKRPFSLENLLGRRPPCSKDRLNGEVFARIASQSVFDRPSQKIVEQNYPTTLCWGCEHFLEKSRWRVGPRRNAPLALWESTLGRQVNGFFPPM